MFTAQPILFCVNACYKLKVLFLIGNMLDVGSYRNALNVLEDGAYVGPPPPRYRSLTPDPHGPSTYRGSNRGSKMTSYRSQENLDGGDWLSVPYSGSGNLAYSKGHRSQDLLDSDRISRPSGSRDVRFRGYSHQGLDDEGFLPIQHGGNSRSVGFSQQASRNNGRHRVADRMRGSGSGGRDGFYPEPARQSTSRVVYSSERDHRPRERVVHTEAVNTNSFMPSSNWDETGGRSSTRLVFDGRHDGPRPERTSGISTQRAAPEERQFLSDVQKELEFQRMNWKDEIERMSGSTLGGAHSSSMSTTKSSFVDTSGVEPLFKAYVDVREFPPSSVTVNVDKLTNKVIVEAKQVSGTGSVAKTFTQKVQMPRFADDTRLSARMNREGILKVEVPLIYYFPEEENGQRTKSFVYEVRKNPDGSKLIEILVKPGQDLSIDDLRVELNNEKLIVSAVKRGAGGASQKCVIKTYTLPENADMRGITSNPTRDGCLTILVPVYDGVYK